MATVVHLRVSSRAIIRHPPSVSHFSTPHQCLLSSPLFPLRGCNFRPSAGLKLPEPERRTRMGKNRKRKRRVADDELRRDAVRFPPPVIGEILQKSLSFSFSNLPFSKLIFIRIWGLVSWFRFGRLEEEAVDKLTLLKVTFFSNTVGLGWGKITDCI